NSINPAHSDAEILDMYDSMVVSQQDKLATKIVSQHATECAALVAVSPLAAADMLLVAWRNFKMIDNLSKVYGVELGYASRIKLLRAVFVNMAAAGASELAIDASMDLMSMDLAGKVSARAGQGLGVGILTARLGLKAMTLLRPLPWYPDRQVKLGTIRKAVAAKVASITMKP
ncbi:TIGR01620 family protein, partial [Vibrio sp. V41_P2S12T139]|nr:TIGR01620 family protein [Vibrio sp. V41_P2S12T139]